MRATLVIKLFRKYSKCPDCGKDIVKYEVKDDTCNLWCECGWEIECNEKDY
ncbi:DUF3797 domain-containing protein [Orenia marismortui]|uniref:Uncharacterized protein DUF3797 n=1 Tax=Orenia marismortui TaxID=46469 RepID=A0A4R8GSY4_9FIRM|nr:DUF3797 domain-containing protein [Orenia marismortui]TDX49123.1 uncharacterized protein DUF3797 [Orenia marismortui]